jgi:hypothetical protein
MAKKIGQRKQINKKQTSKTKAKNPNKHWPTKLYSEA